MPVAVDEAARDDDDDDDDSAAVAPDWDEVAKTQIVVEDIDADNDGDDSQ